MQDLACLVHCNITNHIFLLSTFALLWLLDWLLIINHKPAPLTTDLEYAVFRFLWCKPLFSRSPFVKFHCVSYYVCLELTGPHSRQWKFDFVVWQPSQTSWNTLALNSDLHPSVNTHMQIIHEFALQSFVVRHLISPVPMFNCPENVYDYWCAVSPILLAFFSPRLPFSHLL